MTMLFRIVTSSKQQLHLSEQLLLQESYFLGAAAFSEHSLLLGVKLLPTSYFLWIGSYLGQLVFQNSYFLGRQICSEYQYLQNSVFFEAGTSTKHQIFFEEKMTLSKKIKHKIASLDRDL